MKIKASTLLNLCGVFYAVLCVFSIVTGLMYALGHRVLNPIELSPSMLAKLSEPGAMERFAVTMGWVTFFVGIVQGLHHSPCSKEAEKSFISLRWALRFSPCAQLDIKSLVNSVSLHYRKP